MPNYYNSYASRLIVGISAKQINMIPVYLTKQSSLPQTRTCNGIHFNHVNNPKMGSVLNNG